MHHLLPVLTLLATGCTPEPTPWTRARVIEDLSDTIGGPKSLAQPGDLLLENDRIRVAILGKRYSMSSGLYGGSLVDADLQRHDPRYDQGNGNDIFNELFPTVNMNIMAVAPAEPEFEPADTGTLGSQATVELVNDGSNGEPALVRVTAPSAPFLTVLDLLWGLLGAPKLQYVTEYELPEGASYVRIRTTATTGKDQVPATSGTPIPAATPEMPLLEYAIESGMVMGDFFLAGGSLDVFAPGIGFDESGAVKDAYAENRNLFQDPFVVDWLAGAGHGTSYALGPVEGTLLVPMFTSDQTASVGGGAPGDGSRSRFPDGTAYTYERIFSVGHGDVASAVEGVLEARGTPVGLVEGHVLDPVSHEGLSGVNVMVFRGQGDARELHPYSAFTTDAALDDGMADGSFAARLPRGTWTLIPHLKGHPDGEPVEITVNEGGTTRATLTVPRAGQVEVTVVDEVDRELPAKITFLSTTGLSLRVPEYGDSYIAGNATAVVFSEGGPITVELPPGEYTAVATRGPEYELATSEPFLVTDHETRKLRLQVLHSVDTSGWISADLHVHSESSFDSGTSWNDRVVSMAAEGMDFFAATDHDWVTDYDPVIEELRLESWVRAVPGVEVSPIEVGHFIGWPVEKDFLAPSGGAFDWSGRTPEEIFDGIRAAYTDGVDPLVLIAHPRDGILGYFDQYGMSGYTSSDGEEMDVVQPTLSLKNPLLRPENFTLDADAMEVFNAKRFELIRDPTQAELDAFAADESSVSAYDIIARTLQEQQDLANGVYTLGDGVQGHVDDWFNLLNLGYRITAVGNSDTHDRTSLESGCPRNYILSDTEDPAFIDPLDVLQAVRDHRVVPSYGPFIVFEAEGEPVGSEIGADGAVDLFIEVQTPTWYDIDRVELYENGTLIQEWILPTPAADIVNFAETVQVTPTRDSWYVVVVAGDQDMGPTFSPVDRPYVQLQDVVVEALSPIEAIGSMLGSPTPRPRMFPVYPYALTNPIWVDVGGDGWSAPGLAPWLKEPGSDEG